MRATIGTLALALAMLPAPRRASASCTCTCTTGDFQTYEVDAFKTFAVGTTVTLTDHFFSSGTFTLGIPKRLAAPADVSASNPSAPSNPGHLAGYIIESAPPFASVSGLVVNNRFGTFKALLKRPTKLYVPASKGLTAPPAPLNDPTLDHFLCYDAGGGAGVTKPTVTVADQFGTRMIKLLGVEEICDAVDKNGEGIPTPDQWLTCYNFRVLNGNSHPGNVFVDTQFGQDVFLAKHPDELCVASTVGP
jgi:hypothetical protein